MNRYQKMIFPAVLIASYFFIIPALILSIPSNGNASTGTIISTVSPDTPRTVYGVQVVACLREEGAQRMAEDLREKGYTPEVYSFEDGTGRVLNTVLIAMFDSTQEARRFAKIYEEKENAQSIVKPLNPLVLTNQKKIISAVMQPSEVLKKNTATAAVTQEELQSADKEIMSDIPEGEPASDEDAAETGEENSDDEIRKDENDTGEAGAESSEEISGGDETDDDEEEEAFDEEDEEEGFESDDEEAEVEFSYSGFIEFENYFNTYSKQEFEDANKKNEIRNRLELRYGSGEIYLFTVSDIYFFPTFIDDQIGKDYHYSQDSGVSRNLRISNRESELRFDELYINYSEGNLRLRAGNQIYGWGTADAFNATSYFNPYDVRELIFRDDDEWKVGVPSLSAMVFMESFTLEMVFVPVHVPMVFFTEDTFWSIDYLDDSYPVVFGETHGLDVEPENFGFGGRVSASIKGVDFSLSGYHGPDREPVFVPSRTLLIPDEPISLFIEPKYYVVDMVGFDVTTTVLDNFVVQAEAAYSPNKRGFVKQDMNNYQDIDLPFEVKKSPYISYAVGFNYFLPLNKLLGEHEGESVFTFEWFQSKYFESELYPPFITDIMTCRYEDSYYDSRVNVKVTGIFEMKNGGLIFWPEISYDFQNGVTAYLSYANISADEQPSWEENSLFYYFRDDDIFIWRIRYEY
jgi:hypothetical protein